jgi:hypothetical protein
MTIPATVSPAQAAQLLGVSVDAVYEACSRGDFPVEVIRVGRRLRVPLRPLMAACGLDDETAAILLGIAPEPPLLPSRMPTGGIDRVGAGHGPGGEVVPLGPRSGAGVDR